jgi:hypothetical protein
MKSTQNNLQKKLRINEYSKLSSLANQVSIIVKPTQNLSKEELLVALISTTQSNQVQAEQRPKENNSNYQSTNKPGKGLW